MRTDSANWKRQVSRKLGAPHFGNSKDASDDYVMLQLASEFDAQDHDLGMDGVYFEINDQSHGAYKVIHRIEVAGNSVTLHFSPKQLGLSDVLSPLRIVISGDKKLSTDVHDMLNSMAARTGIDFESSGS